MGDKSELHCIYASFVLNIYPKISTYPHYTKMGVVDLPDILVYTLETRESGESNSHTKNTAACYSLHALVSNVCANKRAIMHVKKQADAPRFLDTRSVYS